MKIGFDAALGPQVDALELRGRRTEVLARNIANADTPGYLARDIDFGAELADAWGMVATRHGQQRYAGPIRATCRAPVQPATRSP